MGGGAGGGACGGGAHTHVNVSALTPQLNELESYKQRANVPSFRVT